LENLVLLFLQSLELGFDVLVIEVSDVLSIKEFWPSVIPPVFVFEEVVLFLWDVELSCSTVLFLKFSDCGTNFLDTLNHSVWNMSVSNFVVPLLWVRNVQLFHDCLGLLGVLSLLSKSMIQKDVAGLCSNVGNTVTALVAHLDQERVGFLGEVFNGFLFLWVNVRKLSYITLGKNDNKWLCLE
jgi:hypothetical protein